MNVKEWTDTIYQRMKEEQDSYRAWLATEPPEKILKHAYEYAVREDILAVLDGIDLTAPQAKVLFDSFTSLTDIHRSWSKRESRHMEEIRDAIEGCADDLIRQEEELRKSPVYKCPNDYAWDNDEIELYRTSHKANIACKKAIETAISNHHEQFSFDSKAAVRDVVGQFGYERTLHVLAATLYHKEHDGRFSQQNKDWARTTPVFADETTWGGDRNMEFVVESHSVLTDAFVETARHEYLLSLPLTKEDIKAEALNILSKFQDAREPNSPNGTHYMAQVSPDFLARASTKDTDRLMAMLPFQSLSLSGLEGRKGTFALISKDENRFQKLVLRKPSVRKKLQEPPAAGAPKPPAKSRTKEQER